MTESLFTIDTGLDKSLIAEASYATLRDGWLTILDGYAWDGPSGMTIDSPGSIQASLIHDCLYQFCREGLLSAGLRLEIDRLFRNQLRLDGMSKFRSAVWYWAVRLGGGRHVQPRPADERRLLVVP